MDNVKKKFYEQFQMVSGEYEEYLRILESVEVMSDNKLFTFYLKKKKEIEELALLFKKYDALEKEIELNLEIFKLEKDDLVRDNIIHENDKLKQEMDSVFEKMKIVFATKKDHKKQQVKIEITTKQDMLFVDEIFNMIKSFADRNGCEANNIAKSNNGIVFNIVGEDIYDKLKQFSGLYKKILKGVDTVALVVVIEEQIQSYEFSMDDVEVQVSRSGGAGGQHINKTESAIRLVHIPTGITAECQDERSQTKNKERAIQNLKEKILQNYKQNSEKYEKNQRKLLKTLIFSETPIIVFDFDRNEVSFVSLKKDYKINEILNGDLDLIINDLSVWYG